VQLIEGLATQDVGQAPARTCVAVQTEGRGQKSANATPSVGEFRPQAPYCSCQDMQVFSDSAALVRSVSTVQINQQQNSTTFGLAQVARTLKTAVTCKGLYREWQ